MIADSFGQLQGYDLEAQRQAAQNYFQGLAVANAQAQQANQNDLQRAQFINQLQQQPQQQALQQRQLEIQAEQAANVGQYYKDLIASRNAGIEAQERERTSQLGAAAAKASEFADNTGPGVAADYADRQQHVGEARQAFDDAMAKVQQVRSQAIAAGLQLTPSQKSFVVDPRNPKASDPAPFNAALQSALDASKQASADYQTATKDWQSHNADLWRGGWIYNPRTDSIYHGASGKVFPVHPDADASPAASAAAAWGRGLTPAPQGGGADSDRTEQPQAASGPSPAAKFFGAMGNDAYVMGRNATLLTNPTLGMAYFGANAPALTRPSGDSNGPWWNGGVPADYEAAPLSIQSPNPPPGMSAQDYLSLLGAVPGSR